MGLPQVLGRTRPGKLALFLTLARVAPRGSRLSAVRWAQQHAVSAVLGRSTFDKDDRYAPLDTLAQRQARLEQPLYRRYVARRGSQPVLFLYDVTRSSRAGAQNALGAYGYHRDGKRGKRHIVVGLWTDDTGAPLAVRVFAGHTAAPTPVPTQRTMLPQRFAVEEVVLVGDGGMVQAQGKAALTAARLRSLTALSEPQGRRLLTRNVRQLELFDEQGGEGQAAGTRYLLRNNAAAARKAQHRRADTLATLRTLVAARNAKVAAAPRGPPEAGWRGRQAWGQRHTRRAVVSLPREERQITRTMDAVAHEQTLQLAGCDVLETAVPVEVLDTQTAHERYKDLAQVAQDIRPLKTGLLEVRPIVVRTDTRTRGHGCVCLLALQLSREVPRRLAATYGPTNDAPHGVTLQDALDALHRRCLLTYPLDNTHRLTRLPRPDAQHTRMLQALQVALPHRGGM